MNNWLTRVQASLAKALEAAERGDVPLHNLYMLAPILYSEEMYTNNDSLLQEMADANEEQVKSEWEIDEQSKLQYKFHYVSSYLFCFVVAGKIDEFKYDKIMEFVNHEMELFTSDYDIE
jgi:hypothetical protein